MHRPECSAFTWYRLILFLRRAGGFTVAGPSKGPDRNRQSQKHPLRTSRPDRRLVCEEKHTSGIVNLLLPPRQSGGISLRISKSELWRRESDAQLNAQKVRCMCKDQCRDQTPSGPEGGLLRATRKTTSAANASGAPSAPSRRIATPLPYNCTPLPPRRSGGRLTITSTSSPGNGNEWARMKMPLLLMSRVVPVLSRRTPSDPIQ